MSVCVHECVSLCECECLCVCLCVSLCMRVSESVCHYRRHLLLAAQLQSSAA